MIDLTKLNSPTIQVDWEDVAENFTQEKLRHVKYYFQQKYKTKNVVVKPVYLTEKGQSAHLKSLGVSESITDAEYQKKLMRDHLAQMASTVSWDHLNRLDNTVNAEVLKDNALQVRHNRWVMKKIEFSNFMSYGDNNVLDFTQLGGITVIESSPANFGGKTTLSVSLLMFLLFNTTARGKTQLDVFNIYRDDVDEVLVKGYMEIDNQDYIIERRVSRKKKKSGEWEVKTDLTFHKMTAEGTWENLSGEQRRETETFIKNAIGDKEDFLMTILSTASNLEDLLEAKATARGQLLTKFLGLDLLRKKEEACKALYTDWSKKMLGNQTNITKVQEDTEAHQKRIDETMHRKASAEKDLEIDERELELLTTQRDTLMLKRHSDVDKDLAKINPTLFQREIEDMQAKVLHLSDQYEGVVVLEPSAYYNEDEHTKAQAQLNNLKVQKGILSTEGQKLAADLKKIKEGDKCPTCGTKMEDCDHSEEIARMEGELQDKREELEGVNQRLSQVSEEVGMFQQLKGEFDRYERDKLRREKYALELQQRKLDLREKQQRFSEWEKNRTKLEENLSTETALVKVRTQIDTKGAEIANWHSAIAACERVVAECQVKIAANAELIGKLKKEEEVQKVFQTYITIFGKNGLSKTILREMIPLINMELARILSDTCLFTLRISISDKNEVEFTMVDNETRKEKSIDSGSGYEKTVAALALRAVLTKVSTLPKPNIIVMDEIFGKVADENLDMVGEFFSKIKNYFEHILLITHNALVKNWAEHVVTVKKENNISVIETA
jgi:DNA repair exonuclease SbcCD ATPase subunit